MSEIRPVIQPDQLATESFEQGSGYAGRDAILGPLMGLTELGIQYNQVPPGKSGCPCHVHHSIDELFVILGGTGEYRFGDVLYEVSAGDILGAPKGGTSRAHKLTNTGTNTLTYLSISSMSDVDICEYPDSGKFMAFSNLGFRQVGRLADARDYWDDEPDA